MNHIVSGWLNQAYVGGFATEKCSVQQILLVSSRKSTERADASLLAPVRHQCHYLILILCVKHVFRLFSSQLPFLLPLTFCFLSTASLGCFSRLVGNLHLQTMRCVLILAKIVLPFECVSIQRTRERAFACGRNSSGKFEQERFSFKLFILLIS